MPIFNYVGIIRIEQTLKIESKREFNTSVFFPARVLVVVDKQLINSKTGCSDSFFLFFLSILQWQC